MKQLIFVISFIAMLTGNLAGQDLFSTQKVIASGVDGAISVITSDFDLDGDMDIAGAAFQGDQIVYVENLGNGNFGAKNIITTEVDGPRTLFAADLDGDGDEEILSASTFDNTISYFENLGNNNFGTQIIISSNALEATSVFAADFDGDGDNDVISSSWDDFKIAYYENIGNGNFGVEQIISSSAFQCNSIYATDVNGDGDIDVLAVYAGNVVYYENIGNGNFSEEVKFYSSINGARSIYAADLDGDGDDDVLAAFEANDLISYFENLGEGNFGNIQVISQNANFPQFVYAKDLDNDGDVDVMSTSLFDDKIAYYENLGGLNFSSENIINTAADAPYSVAVADLNGDGGPDLVSASFGDNEISFYQNRIDGLTKVTGRVYSDANNNNIYDEGEGIMTTLEIKESGNIFHSQATGLYTALIENVSGTKTLQVHLPIALECDNREFISYSFDDPNNGEFNFQVEMGSTLNKDFTIDKVDPTQCTTSSGYVYEDLNSNGVKDNGEKGIPGVTIEAIKSKQLTFTDDYGYYEFDFSTNMEESIKYVLHYNVSCGNIYEHTLPAEGENIAIQTGTDNIDVNFGLKLKVNEDELACYDHSISTLAIFKGLKIGGIFEAWLDTRTLGKNKNTSEIRLEFDPILELLYSDVVPDELGQDYLIWRFPPNEAPERYCFEMRWKISDEAQLGQILNWDANYTSFDYIEPTPFNNRVTRTTEIEDGFLRDNGENVQLFSRNESGERPETLNCIDTRLSYVVTFQNTLMDTVFNLTIIDTLPEALDGTTVEKPFSSHPHNFTIIDSSILIWEFKNIAIPKGENEEVNTYGFVQFNVSLKDGLEAGQEFKNLVHVIFNNGIMESTNEVTHRLKTPTQLTIDACESYTAPSGSKIYTTSGIYPDTILTNEGCDSIIILNLTINNSSSMVDEITACNSYTWIDNITYNSSNNTATHILTNSAGCDSIVMLDLEINIVDTMLTINEGTITANASGATYQWLDCDNNFEPIPGETNQQFSAIINGNYAVEITQGECTETSTCVAIVNLGILENSISLAINVYPNPTLDQITVDFGDNYKDRNLKVVNIMGENIGNFAFKNTNKAVIPLLGPSGIYLINIYQSDGKNRTLRVMKN
jgi:hypothetical protein